jgi:hypothetical protein
MRKENIELFRPTKLFKAFSSDESIMPTWTSHYYDFKLSNAAARIRQFCYILGKKTPPTPQEMVDLGGDPETPQPTRNAHKPQWTPGSPTLRDSVLNSAT